MSFKSSYLLFLPASLLLASSVNADIIIDASEVGNDVVISWSGTLVNTASSSGTQSINAVSIESGPVNGQAPNNLFFADNKTFNKYQGGFSTTPIDFFPSYRYFTGSTTGVGFVIWQNAGIIALDDGVDFTQTQSGTATYTNRTISSMTFIEGTYVWTHNDFVGETITFNVGSASAAVPEPSTTIAMGLLGIVGFAGNRRRRRQVSVA